MRTTLKILVGLGMCAAACRGKEPRPRTFPRAPMISAESLRVLQLRAQLRADSARRAIDSANFALAVNQSDPGLVVLFVVQGKGPHRDLDPIVILDSAGGFRKLPLGESGDTQVVAFGTRWYGRGQRYQRLLGGAAAGMVDAGQPTEHGCVGLGAQADLEPNHAVLIEGGLAITDPKFASTAFRVAEPTHDDSALLRGAALAEVSDSARRWLTPRLVIKHALAIGGARLPHPLLLASAEGRLDYDSTPDRSGRVASIVVLEEWSDSGYHTAWRLAKVGAEEGADTHDLVDIIDLDRDSIPEIVIANAYYESDDYSIISRRTGAWKLLYKGGGGGC